MSKKIKYTLAEAISYIQSKKPIVENNATGFGYKYTTFDKLITEVMPLMREVGMHYSYAVTDGEVSCQLSVGEESVISSINIEHIADKTAEKTVDPQVQIAFLNSVDMNDADVRKAVMKKLFSRDSYAWLYGGAITYAKRYLLGTMLGIATAEDPDASTKPKKNDNNDF